MHVGGVPALGQRAVQQRAAAHRGEGGELRRLPHHGVAAHQGYGGVPGPDGRGEVERADDTDHPDRVPGLHQPVPGPFRRNGPTAHLPAQAHGQVADVDHLLDLAERLGGDLARLDRDQGGQVGLVLGQQLAEPLDDRAARRGRDGTPGHERGVRGGDGLLHARGVGGGQLQQRPAGQRRASRQRGTAVGGLRDRRPDTLQGGQGVGAELGGQGRAHAWGSRG